MLLSKCLTFTLTTSLLLVVSSENQAFASNQPKDQGDVENRPSPSSLSFQGAADPVEAARVNAILDHLYKDKNTYPDNDQESDSD